MRIEYITSTTLDSPYLRHSNDIQKSYGKTIRFRAMLDANGLKFPEYFNISKSQNFWQP